MAKLIQNVEGEILNNFIGRVNYLKPVIGQVGKEDYIKLNGIICFLQNFTNVLTVETLPKPSIWGLKTKIPMTTLEISY